MDTVTNYARTLKQKLGTLQQRKERIGTDEIFPEATRRISKVK